MKIVALEEHFLTQGLIAAWASLPEHERDPSQTANTSEIDARIVELGETRLRAMDEAGVDVQVLSPTAPGVQNLEPGDAVSIARDLNDLTAATIGRYPERFQGFAAIGTPDPAAAAKELERAVDLPGMKGGFLYGRTGDRNIDHADFLPIFEAAAALRVPLYLHPRTPPQAVRHAYYDGFDDALGLMFATSGIGWHYETGIQLVRLILSGIFDRFPDLQIIVGHWGEVVLFYLERLEPMAKAAGLRVSIADTMRRNVSVTPSGMFSQRYLRWAIDLLGIDRIMFSTDYPYLMAGPGEARDFLEQADLSQADRDKIAYGNWERLTAAADRNP